MRESDMVPASQIFGARTPITAPARPSPTHTLAEILHDVRAYVRRYVVLTDAQALAVTLWTAHTHAIGGADCTPYLHLTSATKRSGKTRLLEALEPLVPKPWLTGRTSVGALVRRIDRDEPTLLLDESDAALGRDADREYRETLRGLLNSGYRRSGRVTVCVGQGSKIEARDFRTFAAKAIAGIGELPGTVADRSIRIGLQRRRADERVARWRERDGHAEAAPIRAALATWAGERTIARLRAARPELPAALNDRLADVWEPLLAIADLAGDVWPTAARQAAVSLAGVVEDTDLLVELLHDIAAILDGSCDGAIAGSVLLERLTATEDRPWREWRHGRPLSARGLARLLAPLGIYPDRHETAIGRVRGYRRDAFTDAMLRYLPSQVSNRPSANRDGHDLADSMCPGPEGLDTSDRADRPIETGPRTLGQIDRVDGRADARLPLDGGEGEIDVDLL